MSGDWLHMCTYTVHWIPPFPGKWENFCDNMIGSHLFRFMGAAHEIIIAIYQEARWWIIARFGFLTYSWFVRATRTMICVCDFAANQSTWSCGSSALWSLWSVWLCLADCRYQHPFVISFEIRVVGQQKEVLFSYTCFHSCPGQQEGGTLSSPGKSKQRFKMNIYIYIYTREN